MVPSLTGKEKMQAKNLLPAKPPTGHVASTVLLARIYKLMLSGWNKTLSSLGIRTGDFYQFRVKKVIKK